MTASKPRRGLTRPPAKKKFMSRATNMDMVIDVELLYDVPLERKRECATRCGCDR